MAVYKVKNINSTFSSLEFTPVSEGNFAFFTAKSAEEKTQLTQFLNSPEINQTVLGEAEVGGAHVLITSGSKSETGLMNAVEAKGNSLQLVPNDSGNRNKTWRIISMLAVPGQFLQIASSAMRKNHKTDWGLLLFATSNLIGHAITWNYGAQQSEDTNRLAFVKNKINQTLSPHTNAPESLPAISDHRKDMRDDFVEKTTGEKLDKFMEKNSIYVGEILCRYMGAFALAFPPDRWKSALRSGSLSNAYKAGRNTSELSHYAGLASLTGKTTSLFAKTEDPYNAKPNTLFDDFREKVAFRAGGWIEAGAFGTLTYDALRNPNRRISFQGKEYPDYVGALGSSLFTARYAMRNWAKFGEKNADMEEVYAHASDCLAKMPKEKLPTLVAETTATITEHFKDKHLNYGEVYSRLISELYKYHQIALIKAPTPSNILALPAYTTAKPHQSFTRYAEPKGQNIQAVGT